MKRAVIVSAVLQVAFTLYDWLAWHWLLFMGWVRAQRAATPNRNTPLQLAYQSVADAGDTMESVYLALEDQDYDEASRLLALGRQSLAEHEEHLKGLL